MTCSAHAHPYLHVIIVDRDIYFVRRLVKILSILGFAKIMTTTSANLAQLMLEGGRFDLAFIEIDDAYQAIWGGPLTELRTLIIGMSYDRLGRDWIPAVQKGADSILLKQYYPHLLRAMLSHLLESEASKKLRIVPFPNPGLSVHENATAEATQHTGHVRTLIDTLNKGLHRPRI